MSRPGFVLGLLLLCAPLPPASGSSDDPAAPQVLPDKPTPPPARAPLFAADYSVRPLSIDTAANRVALFGDLHVHSAYSYDATAFGTTATPDDAYRFAQGMPLDHPLGYTAQLRKPLDFFAVTDHAMYLGTVKEAADTTTPLSQVPFAKPFHDMNNKKRRTAASVVFRTRTFKGFARKLRRAMSDGLVDPSYVLDISERAWTDIVASAQRNYTPGKFTTFVAYEYTTASPERAAIHRNVIFESEDGVPGFPFSSMHSDNPEDLWRWMDAMRNLGVDSLAIPHNSNGSDGATFALTYRSGAPIDEEYSRLRIRNEPLVEITQVKGTSETHPTLSPNDEWAGFEIFDLVTRDERPSQPEGSYVRRALQVGLAREAQGLTNLFRLGLVGASDTHTGASAIQEDAFNGKIGINDGIPLYRGSVPVPTAVKEDIERRGTSPLDEVGGRYFISNVIKYWGASGLTGVWADQNDRTSIFQALRRRETFATSGPRMPVRFFAGQDLGALSTDAPDWQRDAYRQGVTMGSELVLEADTPPTFLLAAARDPQSHPLDRLQVIKGWIDNGTMRERVFDVACSDARSPDRNTWRCTTLEDTVDPSDCAVPDAPGSSQLSARWSDPDFDASQHAFYYVRALEVPSCRWSTWDALRAGTPPREDLPATIQERAWSSPIWIQPLKSAAQ